jgi:glucokinase
MSIDATPKGRRPNRRSTSTDGPSDVVLAIDVGADRFEAALVTAAGVILDRQSTDVIDDRTAEAHFGALSDIATELLTAAVEHHDVRVACVGVGSIGRIERGLDTVSPATIGSWRRFPLRRRLEELTDLSVYGDLDARALALAEGWLGAAQGHQNFCTITVSSSIAGGLVLDDDLVDGATGFGGQVGHIIVEPGGRRCICGAQGCLDAEASGAAIESITGRPLTEPTYEIMQRTGRFVGQAAATVCNTLDLTVVVVGGTIARNFAATFLHAAQVALEEHAQLPYSRGARITPSRLGDNGQLIGAGAVGWRGLRRSAKARNAKARAGPQPPNAR